MGRAPGSWGERLRRARERLEGLGVEEAGTKLRWLSAHLLGCGLLEVERRHGEEAGAEAARRFEEGVERLEQLRPLEAGIGIGVAVVPEAEGGVDTPEDALRVERRLIQDMESGYV